MNTKTQSIPQSDSHLSFLTPEELEQVRGLEAELRGDTQILEGIAAEGGEAAASTGDAQAGKGEPRQDAAAAEPKSADSDKGGTTDGDSDDPSSEAGAAKDGTPADGKDGQPAKDAAAVGAQDDQDIAAASAAAAAGAADAAPAPTLDLSGLRETSIAVAVVPAVEDFDGKVNDLRQQMRELTKQYSAGQLDEEVLAEKQFQLQQELTTLSTQQAMHRQTSIAHQQATETAWSHDFTAFAGLVKKAGGPDYLGSEVLFSALRGAIEAEARAVHAKGETLGRFDLMSRAHAAVESAMGRGVAAAGAARIEQPAVQRPNPRGPKTIAHLPSASQPAATMGAGGEFAYLDALDGLDAEVAFAKLTPDQQSRYLQGGRAH